MDPERELCVLLLDGALEEVAFERRAEDLNRAPNVVIVEPGRRPAPDLLLARMTRRLVKRLPGTPRLIVVVGDVQRRLAVALVAQCQGSELLEVEPIDDPARAAFEVNAELWDRLEELGIGRR